MLNMLVLSKNILFNRDNQENYFSVNQPASTKVFETTSTFVFVFGSIQHNWFYNKELAEQIFEKNQYIQSFYQALNGHFSIIIVHKNKNKIRLIANRTGGFRMYLKMDKDNVFISINLKSFKNTTSLNFNALREVFEYRWISGEHSLLNNVHQIPSSTYWDINEGEISHKIKYNYFPLFQEQLPSNVEAQSIIVENLLSQAIVDATKPNSRVAVLLSGGVDSSILSALAARHIDNLVAISHSSASEENPELSTAIQFANELGIEHRIINIDSHDIKGAFIQTVKIIEQPPRFQSSLILYKIFEKISGEFDQIIYGEAADTLFGTNLIKRWAIRSNKQKKLKQITNKVPFAKILINCLPKENKLRALQNEDIKEYILSSNRLILSLAAEKYIESNFFVKSELHVLYHLISSEIKNTVTKEQLNLGKLKSYLMSTDCDNHFHETGAIANHFNLELISPFVDYRIIDYAAKLNNESYLGTNFVKPILRRIGEKYYTPELMYLPKLGFPAPHKAWMKKELLPLWIDAKKSMNFVDSFDEDIEFKWTVAGLNVLTKYLGVEITK